MNGETNTYEAPQCEVIEMEVQGIIAASKKGYENDEY